MEIIEIFKTPVAKFVLDEDTEALAKFSRQCAMVHPSVHISNEGGYQSPNLDLNIPELHSLRTQTTRCFNELKTKFFYKASLVIGNMWLNINYPHSYNQVHNHSRSCFASCFYVSVPKNSGNIVFYNNYEIDNYMPQKWITQFGEYNASSWTMRAENNAFYVFPAWLKHRVETNKSEEDRISISINAIEDNLN